MDPRTILIVEADERTRNWLSIQLSGAHVRVAEASNAQEALEKLSSGPVDLVITDQQTGIDRSVTEFLARLAREKRPYILFADRPNWEGQWAVPRSNREGLVLQAKRFLRQDPLPSPGAAPKARQILIIEDSPTLRGVLRRALEKGFPQDVIREAPDGRQAISEMSQKKVDLIVTDLEMPGMDGHTFLSQLKSNPVLAKKPVLVFSSNLTPELEAQLRELPKVSCLAKPASPERIVEEVSLLLGNIRAV